MAGNLGIKLLELPIADVVAAYDHALAHEFAGTPPGISEENLQARIRGNFLMALSNKFGWMLLTTGNKSEMSVGYSTLYGDLCGGLAVIKDVPKTLVFELTKWRNLRGREHPVPTGIITRPPSAELAPNQQDLDSLPPYDILDPILERYVEDDESIDDIVSAGFQRGVVERVAKLVGLAEYKRRQAPPGLKITVRAFGRDRRMPITNGYRGFRAKTSTEGSGGTVNPHGHAFREAVRASGLTPEQLAQTIGASVAEAEEWTYSQIPPTTKRFFEQLLAYCREYLGDSSTPGNAALAEVLLTGTPSTLESLFRKGLRA
jgi:NAD+ synthetase